MKYETLSCETKPLKESNWGARSCFIMWFESHQTDASRPRLLMPEEGLTMDECWY